MKNVWNIVVANPSDYQRSDYAEVDLDELGVDPSLDESNLCLYRKISESETHEIPYQIDNLLGKSGQKRILVFLSKDTPAGPEDYSSPSASYTLAEGSPKSFLPPYGNKLMAVDHYYYSPDPSKGDSELDGFNELWDPKRPAYGVKLRNGRLEFYISLTSHPRLYTDTNYSGAITSVLLKDAPSQNEPSNPDNMLSPFMESSNKLWGQVNKVVFFPPPWQPEWFYEHSVLDNPYELVYSHAGLMRAVVTLRAGPFNIKYKGEPVFRSLDASIDCYLYRVIYSFPECPFYMEDLFVRSEKGCIISFRPYFASKLNHPRSEVTDYARLENIPDYFGIWKHFDPRLYYGYGVASDAHIRGIEHDDNFENIKWRLPLNFHHRCIHYFMFNEIWDIGHKRDLYHTIGHFGWYERVFKPLRVTPIGPLALAKRYSGFG